MHIQDIYDVFFSSVSTIRLRAFDTSHIYNLIFCHEICDRRLPILLLMSIRTGDCFNGLFNISLHIRKLCFPTHFKIFIISKNKSAEVHLCISEFERNLKYIIYLKSGNCSITSQCFLSSAC